DRLIDSIAIGKRVLAPFGRGDRTTTGFCIGISDKAPLRSAKQITRVLDAEPILTPDILRLTRWMADYYLCGWGQVLNAVVPAGVKQQAGTRTVAFIELIAERLWPNPVPTLTAKQKALVELLKARVEPIELHELQKLAQCGS